MAQGASRRWFLLVEDNEDEERLAARAFKKAGIDGELVVAKDGEEAIDVLGKAGNGDLPAFALLDIKLPKVSGLDVLDWMRKDERFTSVPAVVLVGSVGAIDLSSIYARGANSLVRKELDYEIYMNRMVPTLQYWLQVNAVPQADDK
jgi:two-component system, response regulator